MYGGKIKEKQENSVDNFPQSTCGFSMSEKYFSARCGQKKKKKSKNIQHIEVNEKIFAEQIN